MFVFVDWYSVGFIFVDWELYFGFIIRYFIMGFEEILFVRYLDYFVGFWVYVLFKGNLVSFIFLVWLIV